MPKILIDANIWLGFWSVREGRVSSDLLSSVADIRQHIVFTRQIADEIARRKLDVFIKSSDFKDVAAVVDMPIHMLDADPDASVNKLISELRAKVEESKIEWNRFRQVIIWQIANDADPVYTKLSAFFQNSVNPAEDQLQRARLRREYGNPPGKKSDPLGDQISWEQFVDASRGQDAVFIISRDDDYSCSFGKDRILNPLLRSDLIEAGVEKIYTYDNLAEAIRALKATGLGVAKSIDDSKLENLQREENVYAKGVYAHLNPEIWICTRCNTRNIDPPMIPLKSERGYFSYFIRCQGCGALIDTGEACD